MARLFTESPSPVARDYVACRESIRQGSKTFFAASLLLPERVRTPAYALYAFCRLSDDAVDDPGATTDAVERLRARLDRIYAGRPRDAAADRAFSDVVARHELPRALPEALLDGLEWDAQGRTYRTIEDLRAYAARVAATVGAMMTVLMGVRDADTLARACDLGVAMQLTNIARDVGEDARNGRVYLPLAWLDEEGLDAAAFLAAPSFSPAVARLVARLLDEAETLYRRSSAGVAGLPPSCRLAIHAARLMYREIGCDVARHGHDSVSRRAVVGDARKLAVVVRAALAAAAVPRGQAAEPLPETRFLVEAAATPGLDAARGWRGALRKADDRAGWVIELLGSLEKRRWPDGAPS
jgi:15-cis-phytoene synthase